MRRRRAAGVLLVLLVLWVGPLWAQAPPAASSAAPPANAAAVPEPAGSATTPKLEARLAELQQQVADAHSAGDNAWMLTCSALVLMMTGPGLALFYGGLVRKKNVLATMMQSFALMAVITVVWAVVGYSLCFHAGNPFIGGTGYAFLHNVGLAPDADYAGTIPQQTFMVDRKSTRLN